MCNSRATMPSSRRRPLKAVGLAALFALTMTAPASSDSLRQSSAAIARGDYLRAARLLTPAAAAGNARAEAMLGFLYENGFGVPQAHDVAADLYRRSADRGDPSGQYLLGLMYDKGHGVERNEVLAYKWLNLAAAGASPRERENYAKLRDAVASKMSPNQVHEGQSLALDWRPVNGSHR